MLARAAAAVEHVAVLRRARDELAPAEGETAGAGSGPVSFGPVGRYLRMVEEVLG